MRGGPRDTERQGYHSTGVTAEVDDDMRVTEAAGIEGTKETSRHEIIRQQPALPARQDQTCPALVHHRSDRSGLSVT